MWSQFDHDPRHPSNGTIRAADRDRAVIENVLADAFAEGRITRAEYDERTEAALASRTLGELVPLVEDLPVARAPMATTGDLHEQAVQKWESDRREAVLGFLGLSALLWTIWAITMLGDFPWPLFPTGFALMNVVRTVAQKKDIIAAHERKLLKRQQRALDLEQQKAKELESGSED